ncbi:hypothetical protein [Anabaena sp. AL09]|uniref:hypothetical protein n=1 Tax=Anabaena sp. AL09 TaxID=1710891 RepID=UPI0007FB9EC5|nr:hypothetical protein [Anabaena sp. AL09]OBQ10463.1 MAG: hypothetical protein AN490_08285 [Anabaena sp. AL09]
MYTNGFGYIKRMFDHKGNGRTIFSKLKKAEQLLITAIELPNICVQNLNIIKYKGVCCGSFSASP